MDGLFILLLLLVVFGGLIISIKADPPVSGNAQPSVSINTGVIKYPPNIICDNCGEHVETNWHTIQSDTWDLKCKCGHLAYKHPKREERRQEINDMLDW